MILLYENTCFGFLRLENLIAMRTDFNQCALVLQTDDDGSPAPFVSEDFFCGQTEYMKDAGVSRMLIDQSVKFRLEFPEYRDSFSHWNYLLSYTINTSYCFGVIRMSAWFALIGC